VSTDMTTPDKTTQPSEPAPTGAPMARMPQRGGATAKAMVLRDLHAYYGPVHAVRGVSLDYAANQVTGMIGPSGCGKSTLLRCINRMHEEIPGAYAEGTIELDGVDVYGKSVDTTAVRRVIGMVFQKPNPFPTMSIFDNVAAGLRLTGRKGGDLKERVERSLRGAGLWDEVKDRLAKPGIGLSGGQ
jgi:phosphate transport system ATP-binding protein